MSNSAPAKARKPRSDKGTKRGPARGSRGVKKTSKVSKATGGATGVCLFSGKPTKGKKSRFLPGYDAKLKSLFIDVVGGVAPLSTVPDPAMAALKQGPVLGFKLDGRTLVRN